MRPRFSLRTLLIAVTIVACGCYWLMRPTLYAQRFVSAVRAKEYELADSWFHSQDDRFLADWNEKYWRFQARASLEPWSLSEFVRGKRLVTVQVIYGSAGPLRADTLIISVTPTGLLTPQAAGGVGGGVFDVPLTPTLPSA